MRQSKRPAKAKEHTVLTDDTLALPPGKERALLRHVPFFEVVAQEGHFGRAATRLAMSQPALTRRIQSLEAELGVKLFARDRRTARLTEAGIVFYRDAQRILGEMRTSILRAQKIMRGEAGTLQIAVNDGALQIEAVSETFRLFRQTYPDVEIQLQSMYSGRQLNNILAGELDVGFLYDIVIDEKARQDVDSYPLATAPLVLVINESHPLASKPRLTIRDIKDEPLTWFGQTDDGRSFSDAVVAAYRAVGAMPKIALVISTELTGINMARANLSVGFIRATVDLPPGVVARPIEDVQVTVSTRAVWLRANTKPALRRFLTVLRERLDADPSNKAAASERPARSTKRPKDASAA